MVRLIFCHSEGKAVGSFKRSFTSLIRYCGVEIDRNSNKRTLYLLHHPYTTFRLHEDVNQYTLSQNMGTSVEMVEKFYGHTATVAQANELTKTTKQKSPTKIFDFISS